MRIVYLRKSIMPKGNDPVSRTFEALEELQFQEIFLRLSSNDPKQFLHLTALRQIPYSATVTQRFLSKLLQLIRIRYLVNAINRRRLGAFQCGSDRFIRRKHALLNELVRGIVFDFFQSLRTPFSIKPDFDFGKIQIQRSSLKPFFSKNLCKFPSHTNLLLNKRIGVTMRPLRYRR